MAIDAFNIAERFQLPVILLSDQLIGQRKATIARLNLEHPMVERLTPTPEELEKAAAEGGYKRFRITENGVSPITAPGMKHGQYQFSGLEHTETGAPTSMHSVHEEQSKKRYKKLWHVREEFHFIRRYGPEDADVGILGWGSSKGAIKEAVLKANAEGKKVAAFIPQVLYPFPSHQFEAFLAHIKKFVVVELSFSAQFYKYLRTFLDLPKGSTRVYKRSGAAPLRVEEVTALIEEALA